MKKRIICTIVLALFILFSLAAAGESPQKKQPVKQKKALNSTPSDPNEINWHRYDEGLKLAKETNKKVFLEFTTSWCGWCKKMHATTFKDSTVVNFLNTYYIPVSINAESFDSLNVDGFMTTERGVARDFAVKSYPTYWFLESNGEKIAPIQGYREKEPMADILDYLKDDLYKTIKFDQFLANKNGRKK